MLTVSMDRRIVDGMTQKARYLPIGCFSEGTLLLSDLIPAYLDLLRHVRMSRVDRNAYRKLRAEWNGFPDDKEIDDTDDEAPGFMLEELQGIADNYAPPYAYVGTSEGDGACFGVFVSMPESHDEDVVRSSLVPGEWSTRAALGDEADRALWLHVNDHGNATLYARVGRSWARYREVWSVV